jgi:glycosyltransferase involved in cell wall biosynthesis
MKSAPLVSVVIPTYNRTELTVRAAESVLRQNYDNFELILVDDGSGDGSLEKVSEYIESKHTLPVSETSKVKIPGRATPGRSVRLHRINHTGMPGLVRNRGVELSEGEYIAFLDSDDIWREDKLSAQVAFFVSNPEIRICHTREHWLRNGKTISQAGQRHLREGHIFDDALKKCIIGPSTVMIEKALFQDVGGFREDLEIAEDYELWLRITCRYPVGFLDAPYTEKYAGHGDQLSEKYGHIEFFRIQALKDLVDTGCFSGTRAAAARAELAEKCRIYAQGCRKRGKITEAEKYLTFAGIYRVSESDR